MNEEKRLGGSLTIKLVLSVSVIILVVSLLLALFVTKIAKNNLMAALHQRAQSLAENLAYNSELGVLAGQRQMLQDLTNGVIRQEDILYVMILENENQVLVESAKRGYSNLMERRRKETALQDKEGAPQYVVFGPSQMELYEFSAPVVSVEREVSREEIGLIPMESDRLGEQKKTIGMVRLGVSTERITNTVNRTIGFITLISLGSVVLISIFAGSTIYRVVVVPIRTLVSSMERVAAGELSTQVQLAGSDEIAHLDRSFNRMAVSLKEAREGLEQKVEERTTELQQEILERKKAEEILRRNEERIRLILETAYDAFIAMDAEGKIVEWNPQAERIFDRPRDEVLGRRLSDTIIPPEFREAHKNGMQRYLQTGEGPVLNRQIEMPALHRSGHQFPVELTITAVQWSGGVTFNAFLRDITERKKTEQEIRQLNRNLQQHAIELQEAMKELESFSYSVSHDLRAPLRAIDGFSKMLVEDQNDKLDEEGKRILSVIRSNTQRMGVLIDDLLAFSRLGRQELKRSEVDMEELATSVFRELKEMHRDRKMELKMGTLALAACDRSMIRQVFINLISNAVKFTAGRDVARIEIDCSVEEKRNVYWVRDNGVGFDMKYSDKLFGVFQRLHSAREFEGTGVGLAIVQRVIQKHGGRVWAEAKVGQGATFYFALPNTGIAA